MGSTNLWWQDGWNVIDLKQIDTFMYLVMRRIWLKGYSFLLSVSFYFFKKKYYPLLLPANVALPGLPSTGFTGMYHYA